MAKKRIFTVGFILPGDEFEYIAFGSNQTLLDADIVLFEPALGSASSELDHRTGGPALYKGIAILTEHSSFVAKKQADHWHSEIIAAVNAFRLLPVDDRTEFFTVKCLSAAKRIGAALVRTPDLFAPAKYLKANPSDIDYARACREAIFNTAGTIVVFPPAPMESIISVAEPLEAAGNVPAR